MNFKNFINFINFIPAFSFAVNLSVHIYADKSFSSVIVAPSAGDYILTGDGRTIDSCAASSVYEVKTINDSMVQVKNLERILGVFSTLRFTGMVVSGAAENQICIKPASENNRRFYYDNLTIMAVQHNVILYNIVNLEHYVCGVVQCEAGYSKPMEFYKVQAIICRTYALNNLARHIADGFELCDQVHCQVYQGVSRDSDIIKAVDATKDIVIIDNDNRLINAAFHSNCGGQTLNSEDVWSVALPYLRGRTDTFCLHKPGATWQKQIPAADWNSYLYKKQSGERRAESDSIPISKRVFLYNKGYLIPLKEIRTDWNLHSTYFSISQNGNVIILNGRGYGHRVGLCQQGAIGMAQTGYSYSQILHYYYYNVQLVDYALLTN